MTDSNKKIFGLIGYPLGHSFSRKFFNSKFDDEKINAEYLNFEIDDITKFPSILKDHINISGLNVTIPYKKQIIPYLDEIDADAKAIGAVNVIKIIKNGTRTICKGYNSDFTGFKESLQPLLRENHRHALILGTGGASKAVVHALHLLKIEATYVSRNKKDNALTYNELNSDIMARNTLIINTTPVGMYPKINECPDIPYKFITPQHICYDLIYNPEETLFLKRAKDNGAIIKNGMEMLRLQALKAWEIWNNEY